MLFHRAIRTRASPPPAQAEGCCLGRQDGAAGGAAVHGDDAHAQRPNLQQVAAEPELVVAADRRRQAA